jgi:Holliday junction resolvasome RuvABC endonuclease subunit
MNNHPVILGIDPGTRFMGAAVLRGKELLAYGAHQLRNGERPYELIGQGRRVVLGYVERYSPEIVAIEKPYRISEKRAELLSTLVQELHERAKELGLEVRELTPEDVRQQLTGNPKANKIEVARRLIRNGFGQLRTLEPREPTRAALGLRAKDKYWLHMFDALAVATRASLE